MAVKFLGKQYGLNDVSFGFFIIFANANKTLFIILANARKT